MSEKRAYQQDVIFMVPKQLYGRSVSLTVGLDCFDGTAARADIPRQWHFNNRIIWLRWRKIDTAEMTPY